MVDTGAEDAAADPGQVPDAQQPALDLSPMGGDVSEETDGDDLEAIREEHREELIGLRAELMKRILALQESRLELADRLKEQVAVTKVLERSLRDAERQIQSIYRSRTWRAGSAVRRVFRPIASRTAPPGFKMPDIPPSEPVEGSSPLIEALPAIDPHRLAVEYRAELSTPRTASGSGIGFAVSTTKFGEGRGDLFVAAGLGRYLRRRGHETLYFPPETWHEATGLDWIVAMLPGFRPSALGVESKVAGWARNAFGDWLGHPELERFQVILTSSPRFAEEAQKVYSGDIHLLPIGVDLELFGPPPIWTRSRDGVVTTTNQWGGERDVYQALRSSRVDYPLHIYGQPAGLAPELHSHYLGPVDYFELPGIYWRARVVLDDSHPAVIGWGSVNSRIFDTIAAGALPVTNSNLGLDSLGLADVPTYTASEELNPLVERLLGDPDGTDVLVKKLGKVVRERHSFDRRAEDLAALLTGLAG